MSINIYLTVFVAQNCLIFWTLVLNGPCVLFSHCRYYSFLSGCMFTLDFAYCFSSTVLWFPTYQLVKLRPTNLFLPVPCLINLPNLLDQSNRLTQKEFLMDAFHAVKYFCHLVWHRLFYLGKLICWPFLSVYRLVLAKLQLLYVFWSVFRNE